MAGRAPPPPPLEPLALSAGGRPLLLPGEVERRLLDAVDLEFSELAEERAAAGAAASGSGRPAWPAGVAWVTSHRLLWLPGAGSAAAASAAAGSSAACPPAVALPLGRIVSAEKFRVYKHGMFPTKTPRLRLELRPEPRPESSPTAGRGGAPQPPGGGLWPLPGPGAGVAAGAGAAAKPARLVLACRGSAPDGFLTELKEALSAATWRQPPPADPRGGPAGPGLGSGLLGRGSRGPLEAPGAGSTPAGAAAPAAASLAARRPEGPWSCPQCTLDNPPSASACEVCSAPRPGLGQRSPAAAAAAAPPRWPAGGGAGAAGGSWVCPQCTLENRPAAGRCEACDGARSAALSPGPGWGSGGLVSPGSPGGVRSGSFGGPPGDASFGEPPGGLGGADGDGAGDGTGIGRGFSTARAGVAGILRAERRRTEEADKALDEGFRDLAALMESARVMVTLAQQIRSALQAGGSGSGGAGAAEGAAGGSDAGGSSDAGVADATQMEDWLLSMGIASPVTKQSAGALYHQQLARQLADFLLTAGALARSGGVLTLPDLYCLLNRARGTELVAPDDLLQACRLWAPLGLPLALRQYASGLLTVQAAESADDAALAARLAALAEAPGALEAGLGPSEAAAALGLPLLLAQEHLLLAEARGALCRDDGPAGLRFYRNFFALGPPRGEPEGGAGREAAGGGAAGGQGRGAPPVVRL